MNTAIIYVAAAGFLLAIFPVHVINYIYISTAEKYASVNVTLYRIITLLNFNTNRIRFKKSDKKPKKKLMTPQNWFRIYNKLCITKIVQLCDFGIADPQNAYAVLMQKAATTALYTFVLANGGKAKLKNYVICNYEHTCINYYLKVTGVINVISILKMLLIFIWGILYERKNKKAQQRRTV